MNSQGINPVLCNAVNVDNYILFLKDKYKNNSVRQKISICSSFYSTLKRYGIININPFYNCPLPKKEYKKAVKTDHEKTSPIMNQAEYNAIINELEIRASLKGKSSRVTNFRKSAKALLPLIHFMATYGLRIGAIQTISLHEDSFTVTETLSCASLTSNVIFSTLRSETLLSLIVIIAGVEGVTSSVVCVSDVVVVPPLLPPLVPPLVPPPPGEETEHV